MHLKLAPALGASTAKKVSVVALGEAVGFALRTAFRCHQLQDTLGMTSTALLKSAKQHLAVSRARGISLLGGGGRVTDKAWSPIVPGPGVDRR